MLAMPGAAKSPMDIASTGASSSTSTNSGACRQVVTPEKPRGGVSSHTSAKACVDGQGWSGVGAFRGETGGLVGIIWETCLDPTFTLGVLVGQGIYPVATTSHDWCNTFSHPANFGDLLSSTGSGMQGTSVGPGICGLSSSSSFGRATPQKTSSLLKERYHFTSSLSSNTLC